jgi:hypothetical protein
LRRITEIGQRREATATRDAHPASTGFQVAPGQHVRSLGPKRGRRGGPGKEFIAVGGDHQRIVGMYAPGDEDNTHD